jgi:hypothetical protein
MKTPELRLPVIPAFGLGNLHQADLLILSYRTPQKK